MDYSIVVLYKIQDTVVLYAGKCNFLKL